ncbi:MAG: hypothetical protein GY757_04240, partial [bacterium]|nr:hypothetical protein [bacterium]
MTNDLEIIKRLEKKIGIEFKKAGIEYIQWHDRAGYYVVNEENRVIGLNLAKTGLTEGPVELLELSDLIFLNLGYNEISDFSFLKNLANLKNLHLYFTKISDISFLKDLANLTTLDLSGNQIRQLPRWALDWDMELSWDEFEGLELKGNPLESPPVEIVKEGKKAVIEYFNALARKNKALNEVKVLLVGDGGAGKTSLVKRLFSKRFDAKEPQTHGINIRDKKIKTGANTILTHFWDFGGQEIMHATHQFFLTKRTLYILVLDSRLDGSQNR